MAVAKKTTATIVWNNECDKAFVTFMAGAGWGSSKEEQELESENIDKKVLVLNEQIERIQGQILTLEEGKKNFATRESLVREVISGTAELLGTAATESVLVSMARAKFGIKSNKGRKLGSGNVGSNADLQKKILSVLDTEGVSVTQISKEIGEETKSIARQLVILISENKVGAIGEKRSKKYFVVGNEDLEEDPLEDALLSVLTAEAITVTAIKSELDEMGVKYPLEQIQKALKALLKEEKVGYEEENKGWFLYEEEEEEEE